MRRDAEGKLVVTKFFSPLWSLAAVDMDMMLPLRARARKLGRLFGSTGLILCPGCDAPINTKPENMEAFVAASHKFGTMKA